VPCSHHEVRPLRGRRVWPEEDLVEHVVDPFAIGAPAADEDRSAGENRVGELSYSLRGRGGSVPGNENGTATLDGKRRQVARDRIVNRHEMKAAIGIAAGPVRFSLAQLRCRITDRPITCGDRRRSPIEKIKLYAR